MNVLEQWLSEGAERAVMLHRRSLTDGSWGAEACTYDGFTVIVVAGGNDCETPTEALESLDDELASEAGRLLAAQKADG